jgi:hypothetical protein
MANRDSLHQQTSRGRDLGTGIQLYEIPLLPYERQLIDILDWNEEDYRRFSYLAAKRGQVRPAAYAHIPDINAGPALVPIVVSLVVGAISTAASILLAPKPKAVSAANEGPDNRVSRRRLGGRSGVTRFSPTTGFDSQADLADYASPIPIIFGQYTGATGGIVASPSLVWSRAFSLGSQQSVKLLFVLGEQGLGEGIARPDLNGIFLGNSALDASYSHAFAFYWKRNSNSFSRIKASNFVYGSRGTLASGDIEANDDIFLCPTGQGLADTGFSGAHSPSSSTQFGVHSAIPNATNYRVNWRVISIPRLEDQEDDPKNRLIAERIKIAGDYGIETGAIAIKNQGQKGVGRNYGRRMGVTHLNGVPVSDNGTTPKEVRVAAVGDSATFTIAPGQLPANIYNFGTDAVSVDDINSAVTASRRSADDALQVGETIVIGRTVWVVEARALPIWTEGSRQEIQLRCIETFSTGLGASIGLVSERMISRGVYNDDNGQTNARDALNMSAGAGFYPLLKASLAVVRNTRACGVTEIGIRSQVWNRANGLANFATIPSPSELRAAEFDKISFEVGTMSLYLKRTSVWTIALRPAGTDENGTEYEWVLLGEQFCVTGETPQDQYNYIRFGHPEQRQYEYKFVPKSGADVARHTPDDAQFIRLNAKTNQTVGGRYETAYGAFEVSVTGEFITAGDITYNPEMATNPIVREGSTEYTVPSSVEIETYLPDEEGSDVQAKTVGWYGWLPADKTSGRRGATHYELFGKASYAGKTGKATRTANLGDGRSITIEFNGVVDDNYPDTHPYFPGFRAWSFSSINVVGSSGGFNVNQVFNVGIPVSSENPRAAPYGLTTCGVQLIVLSSTEEVQPKGRESGWEYELLGDAQSYNLGDTHVASFAGLSSSGALATIVATGLVTQRSGASLENFPGQTQAWDVTYSVDPLSSFGTWVNGALIENNAIVSPNNPFRPAGSTIGLLLRVLNLTTAQVPPGFTGERIFEENSQINDISLYGDLLNKSNDSSPEHEITYVNESVANDNVPGYDNLTLCGLSLRSSRNFASVDQLRVWLADGVSVKRFQADATSAIGPSNKFTDLVYYLLTDKTVGAGGVVSAELIRTEDFPATSQFLKANKLFFDGAIDAPTNLRQFISDTAPFFLCNFVISDGKFSLVPALPTDLNGNITQQPLTIQALFTSGNIIENSFSVEYLSSEERKDFQAVVRYRQEQRNQLPEEKTLVVRFAEAGSEQYPIEAFDLTQFCTSRDHAFLVAKFFLSLRRRVTHTVKFRTSPFGISLAPGNFIRVVTEASPYQSARNGTISADGTIVSATAITDGTYSIIFFRSDDDEVTPATMTVAGGKAVEPTLYDSLFTISETSVSSNVYMVEQLTLAEDGMVDVVATEFPTTSTFNSLMAEDVLTDSAFTTEG